MNPPSGLVKNVIDNNVTYANTMPTTSGPVPAPPKSRPPAITPPIGGIQVLPSPSSSSNMVSKTSSSSSSSSTLTTVSSSSSTSSTTSITVQETKRTIITSPGSAPSSSSCASNPSSSSLVTSTASTIVPISVSNVKVSSSGHIIRPTPTIQRPQQQQQQQIPTGLSNSSSSSRMPVTQHVPQVTSNNSASMSVPHSNQHIQARTIIRSPANVLTAPTPGPVDDELLQQLTQDELIGRIRHLETKNRKLIYDNGALMKDLNQSLSQLQSLKHHNFQLMGDNNELRDLCCYLDDERSKARTLAKEWQQFSSHMSKVMRHEISGYASKLNQLENKQFELVRENFELKQLCLLLDNAIQSREIDGQSGSGTEMDSGAVGGNGNSPSSKSNHKVVISQQILEYIRSLELKVSQLEWEKRQTVAGNSSDVNSNTDTIDSSNMEISNIVSMDPSINCPPAVTEAMRVLRIHESMEKLKLKERSVSSAMNSSSKTSGIGSSLNSSTNMSNQVKNSMMTSNEQTTSSTTITSNQEISSEQQKAIVRSLCNVAWKKIEDGNNV